MPDQEADYALAQAICDAGPSVLVDALNTVDCDVSWLREYYMGPTVLERSDA